VWNRRLLGAVAVLTSFWLSSTAMVTLQSARAATSILEEIEWTWGVRPLKPDPALPNVLLMGDSITRAYFPAVTQHLAGVANVYLLATSASVGDPRLPNQLADFSRMQHVNFRAIHFNNGMHGWAYSEAQYQARFPGLIRAIRAISPGARLVWANSTPVHLDASPGPTNLRIDRRNAIAKTFVDAQRIPIDDQHALMQQHLDSFEDAVHFNAAGAEIQGAQAAMTIVGVLRE
jgi:lysophospholipase L1-like esterase